MHFVQVLSTGRRYVQRGVFGFLPRKAFLISVKMRRKKGMCNRLWQITVIDFYEEVSPTSNLILCVTGGSFYFFIFIYLFIYFLVFIAF